MLESLLHANSSFITLTYAEERYDLVPKDLQDWLKRFRRAVSPAKLRFFAVGEYGDRTQRPHYHAAIFGHPACYGGISNRLRGEPCPCPACSVVRETWGFGHVMVARLEMKSAQYIAGYVTKKMTSRDHPGLYGRHPEFARMSLRPGIGANAMHDVASVLMQYGLENKGDVPPALRFGSRIMPLGRYLRSRLRVLVGKDEKSPEASLQALENQLQIVRSYSFATGKSVQSVFAELNQPYAAAIGARLSIEERSL